jgi:hypothetical protein
MIKKLINQPYAPKWEQEEEKKYGFPVTIISDILNMMMMMMMAKSQITTNFFQNICMTFLEGIL